MMDRASFYGGSTYVAITGTVMIQLNPTPYRYLHLRATATGGKVVLTDSANMPEGGPSFLIYNDGSQNVAVHSSDDTFLQNVAGGQALKLCRADSQTKGWLRKTITTVST